jgi:hypothetical protein
MKIKLVLLALFLSGFVFAQVPEGEIREEFYFKSGDDPRAVPYMYVGSDTLEYMNESAANLKVIIDDMKKEGNDYYIRGRMQNAETGEALGNNGKIILGDIAYLDKIQMENGRKGFLIRIGPEYKTENGAFSLKVDGTLYDNLVFIAENYGAVDFPIKRKFGTYKYWSTAKKFKEAKMQELNKKRK